ncbi:MAG: HD domain-containing protein [Candidatus Micrarchaeota archaeon]|nr:HD domain-containing protein [Candidatus Micrarchaeota archaeon]
MASETREVVRFFKEVGLLKQVQRSGWFTLGFTHGDTIAAHSHRTSIIAYYLAKRLNANVEKVLLMSIFHDVPETRSWDLNKISQSYVSVDENKILREQLSAFPEIQTLYKEYSEKKTLESKITNDADFLECTLQAKFYMENNSKMAEEWLTNASKRMTLDISKELVKEIAGSPEKWWEGLKKLD